MWDLSMSQNFGSVRPLSEQPASPALLTSHGPHRHLCSHSLVGGSTHPLAGGAAPGQSLRHAFGCSRHCCPSHIIHAHTDSPLRQHQHHHLGAEGAPASARREGTTDRTLRTHPWSAARVGREDEGLGHQPLPGNTLRRPGRTAVTRTPGRL